MAARTRNISLRAILFADLAGYSRLVSRREAETLDFVEECFRAFRAKCPEFGGEIVKTTGDGVLASFGAVSQAVNYALAMHEAIDALQAGGGDKGRFRVGIHLGEVERLGSDIYGHTVNIAARLVTLAKPGGICVSHEVYRQVRRTTTYGFIAAGLTSLRNIPEPIAVYHLVEREEGEANASEGVSIQTIDGLSVASAAGDPVPLPSGRLRALLGYLALAAQTGELQDRIAALLWPDRDPKAARRALADCARAAGTALGNVAPGVLIRRGEKIGFDPSLVEVDLARMSRDLMLGQVADLLIERPDWPEAILLGLEDVSRLYRSWLAVARHNWREKVADALETCLTRFEAAEPAARRAASALLALEPSHEPAAQKLIQHYTATRNAALAIKAYQEFAARLDAQFHIAPSADTVALVESVMRGRTLDPAEPMLKPEPSRPPRIAFGKFEAVQPASTDAYLIAGFRSELLVNLSRFREWVILEAEAGEEKGAAQPDYVVSARCGSGEAGLNCFVTLSEPSSLRVIWSETFEVSTANWFASQRLLVRRIAAHLQVYLSSDRLTRTISQTDSGASDHGDWLKGEHLLSLWNAKAEDEAALIFARIIKRSPGFAPAYASLAGIYNVRHLIRPGSALDARQERHGMELGEQAVELDALDSRNHLILAWSSAMAGAYEQASVHYDLAASLNPSSPSLLISCAQGFAFVGAAERASELLREAFDLAPFFLKYQWCYIASTRAMIGDYEDGVMAARRGGNATLDTPGWRAVCLAQLGRLDEAKAAFAEQVELVRPVWAGAGEATPEAVRGWFLSAFPIGREADRERLRKAFEALT